MKNRITIEMATEVISKLPHEFNSHNFIENFTLHYEGVYKSMLMPYNEGAIQKVNAMIGRYLSNNQTALGIRKSDKAKSKNFHGKEDNVAVWRKVSEISITAHKVLMVFILIFASSFFNNMHSREASSDSEKQVYNDCIEQLKGWEWFALEWDSRERRYESYPSKQYYYYYSSHPNYRVVEDTDGISYSIYDTNGTLVRIAWLVPGRIKFTSNFNEKYRLDEKKQRYNNQADEYLSKCKKEFLNKMKPLAQTSYRIDAIGDNEYQIYKYKNGLFDSGYTSELKGEDEDYFNNFLNSANADTTLVKLNLRVENLDKKVRRNR